MPGSKHEFPECPAAYLRTESDIAILRTRREGHIFDAHLVDGTTHADELIAPMAHEFKNGARTMDSMSSKVQQLVKLRLAEENARDAYEDELRDQERKAKGNGGR